MDLEELTKIIEGLSKEQHIEVLKIIHECSPSTINENKSGIYINMTFLNMATVEKLKQYILYIQDQEKLLKPFECQKEDFKNTFFIEKELKDNMLYSFRN